MTRALIALNAPGMSSAWRWATASRKAARREAEDMACSCLKVDAPCKRETCQLQGAPCRNGKTDVNQADEAARLKVWFHIGTFHRFDETFHRSPWKHS
jgi:hypothetical protein